MLDIKFIRENPEKVKAGIAAKGVKDVALGRLIELDRTRRSLLAEVEKWQAEQNLNSESVARAKAEKNEAAARTLLERAVEIKVEIQKLQPDLEFAQREYDELMLRVPNMPMDDVPIGKSEEDNVVIREVWYGGGEVNIREESYTIAEEKEKQFVPPWPHDFKPRDSMDIAEKLDWIDTAHAAKVSGTRFGYLKREAALMEFGLVHLALRILTSGEEIKKIAASIDPGHSATPFIPVLPPVMIRPDVFTRMARLNDQDKDERYYLPVDDLYLVGSAEHTLGPLHMDEILAPDELPLRYVGFSTSFRREVGSYGKDTHGIFRVHQFDKVEMESFTLAEHSRNEQDFFVAIQEHLMQQLRIPYRVVMISAGDMGKPDARQIDLEAWMPGQGRYRETHTADLMTDYQARRLHTRVRRKKENEYAHMNDATVFAIGRTLIAIIENYQQEDGLVEVPEALKPLI